MLLTEQLQHFLHKARASELNLSASDTERLPVRYSARIPLCDASRTRGRDTVDLMIGFHFANPALTARDQNGRRVFDERCAHPRLFA